NLMVAANALGFASVWLTGWHAYDRSALARIGVAEHERVAGFIHIGRADDPREDRPRPLLADIVTRFRAYYDAWPTAVRAIGDFGNGEYVGAQADSSASSRSDGRRGRSAARRSAVAPDAFAWKSCRAWHWRRHWRRHLCPDGACRRRSCRAGGQSLFRARWSCLCLRRS